MKEKNIRKFIGKLMVRMRLVRREEMGTSEYADDRRNFTRIIKEVKIEVCEISYPLSKATGEEGRSKNIGEGGICFSLPIPFSPGALLGLKIYLPAWQKYKKSFAQVLDVTQPFEPLSAIGEVIWCNPNTSGTDYEIGVKFVDIYEDDYEALVRYLDKMEE